MTPFMCAMSLADFIGGLFAGYKTSSLELPMNVYAGFLPKAYTAQDKRKNEPYVVVRPIQIVDGNTNEVSTCELEILCTVYDDNITIGCKDLYHILQVVRHGLLTSELISERYDRIGEFKTIIPEEQPFPRWWGYIYATYGVHRPEPTLMDFTIREKGQKESVWKVNEHVLRIPGTNH